MNDTSHNMHLASDVLHLGLTSDIFLSTILALLLLPPYRVFLQALSNSSSSSFPGLFVEPVG